MKNLRTLAPEADSQTIDYYNKNGEEYAEKTLHLQLNDQWLEFTTHIKPKGKILDIGCGSGRDMIKFQQLGFFTEGLEASPVMARIARQNSGSVVHEIPIEKMTFNEQFDGVWACASLLHVHEDNLLLVFEKIFTSLKSDGCFYFSLKHGKGQIRHDDERLFVYYNESRLRGLLNKFNYINTLRIWTSEDSAQRAGNLWMNCIIIIKKT